MRISRHLFATGVAVHSVGCHVVARLDELEPTAPAAGSVSVAWIVQLGDASPQQLTALTVDANDDVVAAISFGGTLAVGDDVLTNVNDTDLAIVELGPDGSPRWAKSFGAPGSILAHALDTGPSGEIAFAGTFRDTITIGDASIPCRGDADTVAAMLDTLGEPLWARSIGNPGFDKVHGVTVVGTGELVVAGQTSGTPILAPGDEPLGFSCEGPDGFVLRFDESAKLRWAKRIGGPGHQRVAALARDSEGILYLAGTMRGSMDIDGHVFATQGTSDADVFFVKLDGTGDFLLGQRVGDDDTNCFEYCEVQLAVDSKRRLAAAVAYTGHFALGSTAADVAFPDTDLFVAKFDEYGQSGALAPLWVAQLDDATDLGVSAAPERPYGMVATADGGVVVTGTFGASLRLGDTAYTNADTAEDLFVVALDESGAFRWGVVMPITTDAPDLDEPDAPRVAVDSNGDVIVGGWFRGTLDLLGQRLEAKGAGGEADSFIVKLSVPKDPS